MSYEPILDVVARLTAVGNTARGGKIDVAGGGLSRHGHAGRHEKREGDHCCSIM